MGRGAGGSLTDLNPQPGMPMAWRTKSTSWTKKMKKKTKKLNELSLLRAGKAGRVGEESRPEQEPWGPSQVLHQPRPSTYLKALYMGRYQHMKEQGVKSRTQRIESPKPEPLLVSTQKLARQARKFRRRANVLPEGWTYGTMSVASDHKTLTRRCRVQKRSFCLHRILHSAAETEPYHTQSPLQRHLKDSENVSAGGQEKGEKDKTVCFLEGGRTRSK